MIDDNRAIFMFKDGSQAWESKDYIVQQERCESVSLENKVYPGKGSPNYGKDELWMNFSSYSAQKPISDRNDAIFQQFISNNVNDDLNKKSRVKKTKRKF